jgi:Kef-type K+ transport system membrane component KefB
VRKVFTYSLLLIAGLIASQFLQGRGAEPIRLLTMLALAFIMVHVGYEFEIDKSRAKDYGWDAFVAFTAASLPWLFCAAYFVFVMTPAADVWTWPAWRNALLEGLFAAPTSAGVLFSMLAAAGLGATWVFAKARLLAIFDDLSTILLLIPFKAMFVGPRWQLAAVAAVILALLWLAWKYLNRVPLPVSWPWTLAYAALIVGMSEGVYVASKALDPLVPVHLEVLLPAFALGCMLKTPAGQDPRRDDMLEGVEEGPETPVEQRVSTIISACFMVLVGLSMPVIRLEGGVGWGEIAVHVLLVTVMSNVGKMFPLLCYRAEAPVRERLALSIGMWPRGEVGAGVLVIALSYGIAGPALTVAILSLALNLLLTGVFILMVKRLIAPRVEPAAAHEVIMPVPVIMPGEEAKRAE